LVVDQGDRPNQELEELVEHDRRLRYVHVAFKSTTRARNFGVALATAEVIVFAEDDIIPDANLLLEYAKYLENPVAVGATGPVLNPGQRLRQRSEIADQDYQKILTGSKPVCDVDFPHAAHYGAGGNSAYRRKSILDIGGFDECYEGNAWGEELEFSHRFREQIGEIRYLPRASVVHLQHPTGGSRTLTHGKYVRSFARNAIYTKLRTGAGTLATLREAWHVLRRFIINKAAFRRPRPHWVAYFLLGCFDGIKAGRSIPLLPHFDCTQTNDRLTLSSQSRSNQS
jgi:GT2 family glycosyltransferase